MLPGHDQCPFKLASDSGYIHSVSPLINIVGIMAKTYLAPVPTLSFNDLRTSSHFPKSFLLFILVILIIITTPRDSSQDYMMRKTRARNNRFLISHVSVRNGGP